MGFRTQVYGDIEVFYKKELDGGGMRFGQQYIPMVRRLFGKVETVYELCAGPAFIGFSLLAEGLCDYLCLSDINPEAIEALHRTRDKNGLERQVRIYQSDGLREIPRDEKWDLVVSNPPHFNRTVGDSIIRNDPQWCLHREFYLNVGSYLKDHGSCLIQENFEGSDPADFEPMIRDGGLRIVGTMKHEPKSPLPYYFCWSKKRFDEIAWSPERAEVLARLQEGNY